MTILPNISFGLGCMGMSQWYGPTDEVESIATIQEALDSGNPYLDSAEAYGPFTNEILIGKAVRKRRHDAFIATKFGFPMIQPDGSHLPADSSPDHIRHVVDESLRRLQTDHIDLLYQHRIDKRTPIEDVEGIETALIRSVCGSSEYPIAVSVAIILTPRFPYKTAIIAPQGDDS